MLAPLVLPRLLARDWPELFSRSGSLYTSIKELYNLIDLLSDLTHSRNIARSGFRPLSKIPDCCF